MSEESRAAQFRADHEAGAIKRQQDAFQSLPGDADALATLQANWSPWIGPFWWDVPDDPEPQVTLQTPFGPIHRGAGREIL